MENTELQTPPTETSYSMKLQELNSTLQQARTVLSKRKIDEIEQIEKMKKELEQREKEREKEIEERNNPYARAKKIINDFSLSLQGEEEKSKATTLALKQLEQNLEEVLARARQLTEDRKKKATKGK